uniref:CBM21 domain-containing protein n=1 Tax=Dracunculus medinensis TaxID=318479 RepID=A0A0N4U5A5_DRAME
LRSKSLRSALRMPTRNRSQKSVRFADVIGLNLVQQSYYEKDDTEDLKNVFIVFSIKSTDSTFKFKFKALNKASVRSMTSALVPLNFSNRSQAEISNIIQTQRVSLDSVNFIGMNITGTIDVLNVTMDKRVYVRYTFDAWKTSIDSQAKYSKAIGEDGAIDAFNFLIVLPPTASCEFCIHYNVNGESYWDNNDEKNYIVQVIANKTKKNEESFYCRHSFTILLALLCEKIIFFIRRREEMREKESGLNLVPLVFLHFLLKH